MAHDAGWDRSQCTTYGARCGESVKSELKFVHLSHLQMIWCLYFYLAEEVSRSICWQNRERNNPSDAWLGMFVKKQVWRRHHRKDGSISLLLVWNRIFLPAEYCKSMHHSTKTPESATNNAPPLISSCLTKLENSNECSDVSFTKSSEFLISHLYLYFAYAVKKKLLFNFK